MKRLLAATAALSLIAATAAHAEDQHQHGGGGGGQPHGAGPGPSMGGSHGGGAPHFSPQTHSAGPVGVPQHTGPVPYVPQGRNDHPHNDAGGGIAGALAAHADNHLGHSFGAPGFTPQGGDRPRYDPRYFPHQIHANRHFDWRGAHDWHDQPGFYYRRWAYGEFLPVGWFAAEFWIDDYFDYDLPVPPYGYEWVRSGPDALLVDTYTGEVVEAVYGVF